MAEKTHWTNDEVRQVVAGEIPPPGPLSWSEVPGQALANTPESAGRFLQDIIAPVMHPIDTASAFYDIGAGLLAKAGLADNPNAEEKVNAIGQYLARRYTTVDGFKEAVATDPVGILADLGGLLSGGGALAAKAPGMIGRVGRVATKVGTTIDPTTHLVKGGTKVAKKIGAPILGLTTGAGTRAVQEAAAAGASGNQAFERQISGAAPMRDPYDMAQNAMRQLRADRQAAYVSSKAGWAAGQTELSLDPLREAIAKARAKAAPVGVQKSADATKVVTDIEAKLREYVQEAVRTKGKLRPTAVVMDDMKQAIGEIRQKTEYGTLERTIADDVYHALKKTISDQAPDYADAMKSYSDATEQIGELTKTFSLGEKASMDTALRKLQSIMRNNVNTNYGYRTSLAEALSKYEPNLMPALAGQALNTPTPRGIMGPAMATVGLGAAGNAALQSQSAMSLFDPSVLAIAAASSPKLVGRGAQFLGANQSKIAPAMAIGSGVTRNLLRPEAPMSKRVISNSEMRKILEDKRREQEFVPPGGAPIPRNAPRIQQQQ